MLFPLRLAARRHVPRIRKEIPCPFRGSGTSLESAWTRSAMPPTPPETPPSCGWRTSTPTCRHPRWPARSPMRRWRRTTPIVICRSRATARCARPRGARQRHGWPALRSGHGMRQRGGRAQRHPQRPAGHGRARPGSRNLRSDLCRAGEPHPAGGRDSPARALRPRRERLGDRSRRTGRGHRPGHGRRAADEPGHADRSGPGQRAFRRHRRPGEPAWRVGHLGCGHGTDPLPSPSARASRRPPGPGRAHHHGRLGLQGTADDRLAGGLGRRAAGTS